jgi:multidrug efflux pump subunit AcrA (membrane-fusion protein)
LEVPEYGKPWPRTPLSAFSLVSAFDTVLAVTHLGERLVEIDPRTYAERVEQARNRLVEDNAEIKRLGQEAVNNQRRLAKVKADVDTYETELLRMRDLRKKNAVTISQLATAEVEMRRYEIAYLQRLDEQELFPIKVEQAEKRRETHRADLEMAQFDMAHTDIRAPFLGRISEVFVEQGQFVRVGDPLIRLTDVRRVEVPLPITLSDYNRIAKLLSHGDGIRVEFAEHTNSPKRWEGTIRRVSPEVDASTRTVMLYAVVDNEAAVNEGAPELLAGTFLHARIYGKISPNVIAVPRDSVVDGNVLVVRPVDAQHANSRSENGPTAVSSVVEVVPVVREINLHSLAILKRSSGIDDGSLVVLTNLDVLHDLIRKYRKRQQNKAPAVSYDPSANRTVEDEIARQVPMVIKLLTGDQPAPQ